jgi:parvulin-like peptidyl-prolyl isomerase
LGAVAGLAIAGYQLLTARGTETRRLPDEDVALINQQPILRSDFITQTETETGMKFESTTHAQRLQVLDEMVQEELKVQRGLELNFVETDQDSRNAVANVVDQQMVAEVVTSQPTDQQLLDFYNAHHEQYHTPGTMTVCDLLLPGAHLSDASQAATMSAAVAALRGHNPLAAVLQRYGLVNHNNCENNLYFAIQIHLGDALFRAATALDTGGVSAPLQGDDGIHILQMQLNEKPIAETFSESRDAVRSDMRAAREAQLRTGSMNFLRRRSKMLIAEEYRDYQAQP